MSLGKSAWSEARTTLQRLLSAQEGVLRDNVALREQVLIKQVGLCDRGCGERQQ